MGERGQSIIEAVLVVSLVLLASYSVLNIVHAGKTAFLMEYSTFVVARNASVRTNDEDQSCIWPARTFLSGALREIPPLVGVGFTLTVNRTSELVEASMDYRQRRKYVLSPGKDWWDRLAHWGGMFYRISTRSVLPLE